MIEVGAEYALLFGNNDATTYKYGIVKEYNHPLIKFVENAGGAETIINLASGHFVSATKR